MTLFGTDGIRARAGEGPLSSENVHRLGLAIGKLLRKRPTLFSTKPQEDVPRGAVLLGRDTRASGEPIEAQLTTGLMAFGNEVWSAGVIPTPGVAYLARAWSCALGVVVSASHNPAEDNGIKLLSPEGFKAPDVAEAEIEKVYNDPNLHVPNQSPTTIFRRVSNRTEEYVWFLSDQFGGSLSGMKIIVDCAQGATSSYAPSLLQSLGAKVVAINASPDGQNINKNAAVLQPELLVEHVRKEKADLAAAYDGDGDRCILIDETGTIRDGDHILAACAQDLPPGSTVVSTVMANYALEAWLKERNISLRRTPVGDRFVADVLSRTGATLGGEQSGHILFLDASPTGDGLLTTMRVLRLMREKNKTLSQLCAGFVKSPQALVNVPVREKPPLETVEPISRAIREAERGLAGRILVRYSGTEPLCRVMVEGPDAQQVQRLAQSLAELVKQHLG
ncbi:MAG: phosphoglucosamine mutase [Planctomycetes bacterium]|nr:phosphoglucosamine mutase [Planctomycetota bacterium]